MYYSIFLSIQTGSGARTNSNSLGTERLIPDTKFTELGSLLYQNVKSILVHCGMR